MENTPLSSIDLPPTILHRLQTYQAELELPTLSDAVVDVLIRFFQVNEPAEPNPATTYAPLQRVETLETRVERLAMQVDGLRQMLLAFQSSTFSPQTAPLVVEDDDMEDEPDEILYDFLPPEER